MLYFLFWIEEGNKAFIHFDHRLEQLPIGSTVSSQKIIGTCHVAVLLSI